jgi:hypothetical protein
MSTLRDTLLTLLVALGIAFAVEALTTPTATAQGPIRCSGTILGVHVDITCK